MLSTECLPRQTLKEYVSGWTNPRTGEAIEAHLLECSTCEQTLSELEADPDTLCELLQCTPSETQDPSWNQIIDPAVDYALSRAKRVVHQESTPTQPWRPATSHVGPYELLKPLGQGGMGAVYLARHQQLGKQVAIKLLPARSFRNDHYAARFQREIRAAGQLIHPAIVSATDAGEHQSTHFLVMEFIDGLDLSGIARQMGPLSIADACAIMQTVAGGLSYAHAQGIVHRDIKPSNLMIGRSGEVKILDFGLAQVSLWDEVSAELTTVGQLMGTLDYMAPEQAERADAVDYRADLYAMGSTLFRLLCGRAPLAAAPDLSPLAKLRLLGSHEPPQLNTLRPDAPPELVALMNRLLARNPLDRPASAAHVSESLAAFSAGADLKALVLEAQAQLALHPEPVPTNGVTQSPDALPQPKFQGPANPPRWRKWLVAGMLLPLFAIAGVLVTLELQKGQLVIDSEGASVEVNLLRDGQVYERLQVKPGPNVTRLYAGKYEVVIDSGSDAFTLSSNSASNDSEWVEITRGGTTIANIGIRDKESNGSAFTIGQNARFAPPASDAVLQPGDRLQVRSIRSPELDADDVGVLADHTLKLRLIGVVDVKGLNLQQLEQVLIEKYRSYVREPDVEVFRVLPNAQGFTVAGAAADGISLAVGPTEDSIQAEGDSELMYEGRTLSQWLDQLSRERSPAALGDVFEAVEALVTPETSSQITAVLLDVLPKTAGLKVTIDDQAPNTVDNVAFVILAKAQSNRRAFMELMVRELESATNSWASRILGNFNLYYSGGEVFPESDLEPLMEWIDSRLLKSADRSELTAVGAQVLFVLVNYGSLRPETVERLLQSLQQCPKVNDTFWLKNFPDPVVNSNELRQWNVRYAEIVERVACRVFEDTSCDPESLVRAALLLCTLNSELYDRTDLSPAPLSFEAWVEQLLRFNNEPLATLTISGDANVRNWMTKPATIGPIVRSGLDLRFDSRKFDGGQTTLPLENLLRVGANLKLKGDSLDAVLKRVIATHQSAAYALERKLFSPPANPRSAPFGTRSSVVNRVTVDWPSLDSQMVGSSNLKRINGQMDDQPTKDEWLASIVVRSAFLLLTDESQQTLLDDWKAQLTSDTIRQNFRDLDQDGDGRVSIAQAQSVLPDTLQDSDGDGMISEAEFLEQILEQNEGGDLGAPAPTTGSDLRLQWAEVQIARYDKNKDGVLDASESNKMLIDPSGADADQDGLITAQEYASFSRTRNANK